MIEEINLEVIQVQVTFKLIVIKESPKKKIQVRGYRRGRRRKEKREREEKGGGKEREEGGRVLIIIDSLNS